MVRLSVVAGRGGRAEYRVRQRRYRGGRHKKRKIQDRQSDRLYAERQPDGHSERPVGSPFAIRMGHGFEWLGSPHRDEEAVLPEYWAFAGRAATGNRQGSAEGSQSGMPAAADKDLNLIP
jgi:hypothetical protein